MRTSLDDFLTQNGISAETTLNVEYVKALVPPLPVATYEHDDWISSVDIASGLSGGSNRILSGSFDGSIRVWGESSQVIATGHWHKASVHSAKFLTQNKTIVSAGSDRSVRIWDFENRETSEGGKLTPKLELLGHKSIVHRIDVHQPSSRILTASSDNTIGLWTSSKSSAPPAPEVSTASNKRRKLSGPSVSTAQRGALSMLGGHQNHVKDITFDARDATVAYSGSMDHTVKTWDLTTSACVDTKTTSYAIFSICHLPDHSIIASGNAGNTIDLIDLRASAMKVSALSCIGHTNWVRSIARNPTTSYQFVSASSDSTCRIWDIRSTSQSAAGNTIAKPVYTIERESQKALPKPARGSESTVFAVAWNETVGIVSGGEDKRVQINRAP